jgi:hypothetical protein
MPSTVVVWGHAPGAGQEVVASRRWVWCAFVTMAFVMVDDERTEEEHKEEAVPMRGVIAKAVLSPRTHADACADTGSHVYSAAIRVVERLVMQLGWRRIMCIPSGGLFMRVMTNDLFLRRRKRKRSSPSGERAFARSREEAATRYMLVMAVFLTRFRELCVADGSTKRFRAPGMLDERGQSTPGVTDADGAQVQVLVWFASFLRLAVDYCEDVNTASAFATYVRTFCERNLLADPARCLRLYQAQMLLLIRHPAFAVNSITSTLIDYA